METGVARLLETSVKLKSAFEVTSRGLLCYHQFMRTTPDTHHYSPDMVAAAALSLGGKLSGKPFNIDAVVLVFYSSINKTEVVLHPEDPAYMMMKHALIRIERVMSRSLEFDFNVPLAHQFLVPFLTMIIERSKNLKPFEVPLGRTTFRFLNDCYTIQRCLDFKPEVIAIACIDLALHVHGVVKDVVMTFPWYEGFVTDITVSKVEELKSIIMKIYENEDLPFVTIKQEKP